MARGFQSWRDCFSLKRSADSSFFLLLPRLPSFNYTALNPDETDHCLKILQDPHGLSTSVCENGLTSLRRTSRQANSGRPFVSMRLPPQTSCKCGVEMVVHRPQVRKTLTVLFHFSPRLCPSAAGFSLPSMPSIVFCMMLFCSSSSSLAMSSCHLLLGRPLDLFPLLCCHSVQRLVHLVSFFLAICPAHFHFCFNVFYNVNYLCSSPDLLAWYFWYFVL